MVQSPAAAPVPAPEEVPARDPYADSVVNLHLDALGALQFGITPTVEFGKKISGYVRLRPMNTGMMSYVLIDPTRDDHFRWGLGAAVGMHFFSAGRGNMRGLFGGPGLEYLFIRTRDDAVLQTDYGVHVLVPQLDLGYRWGFGRFLLGVGGRVGVYVPVRTHAATSGPFGCDEVGACDPGGLNDLHAALGVFLDLGWFL
ncbi:MAG TPA: hypothetical protein VI299_18130 [Polyangiales bacterium]